MKVLNIGTSEVKVIEESLEMLEDIHSNTLKNAMDKEERKGVEYELAHVRTTRKLLQDQRLQELCEKCLSYFWDRLSEEGVCNPDVEWLSEEMVLTEQELMELFKEAGFEEE